MSRHSEYMDMMSPLSNVFDIKDVRKHELVAFLLMKCGNVANTMRTFFLAQDQVNRLLQKYQVMVVSEQKRFFRQTDPIKLIELSFIIGFSLPLILLLESVSDELLTR